MATTTPEILVPLDGSEMAELVLPHVVTLARAAHADIAEVTLLQVVPLPITTGAMAWSITPAPMYWDGWQEELNRSREYLEEMASGLREHGLQVNTQVREGEPASEIIEYMREHPQLILVALATHGRSGMGRWLFGSVAERVLHAANVPLLMVRPEEEPEESPGSEETLLQAHPYNKIVVPLDGSPFAEQALDRARHLAAVTGATLLLVSAVREIADLPLYMGEVGPAQWIEIWREEEEQLRAYLESTAQALRDRGIDVLTEVQHGQPADTILHVSEDAQADLIVMSTHGRTGLGRFWLGSVALRVVQGSRLPVLLIRAVEDKAQEAGAEESASA